MIKAKSRVLFYVDRSKSNRFLENTTHILEALEGVLIILLGLLLYKIN